MNIKTSQILLIFFLPTFSVSISVSVESSSSSTTKSMAEAATIDSSASSAAVYIVYTEKPTDGADPESFHLHTLSSILGSEEAAKESLIYVYKNAATGFSAKLTLHQVSELEKLPGVLQVVPSETLKLHSGVGTTNMRI